MQLNCAVICVTDVFSLVVRYQEMVGGPVLGPREKAVLDEIAANPLAGVLDPGEALRRALLAINGHNDVLAQRRCSNQLANSKQRVYNRAQSHLERTMRDIWDTSDKSTVIALGNGFTGRPAQRGSKGAPPLKV